MSRLIDADKLKAHYAWWKGGTREMTMDEAKNDFDTIIDLQPTIEAEPVKRGRWEKIVHPWYECSECGERTAVVILNGKVVWNYCPNCGAKMDLTE